MDSDSDSDREIQAIIANPSTRYWLSDAEFIAGIFAKRAQEKAEQAMTWLAVQLAARG